MQNRRHERVRELLKRTISEIIRREIPVNEAGLISVVDVGVANDLHSALVFVSILGGDEQQKKGLALLNEQHKFIQSRVGQSVVLKHTPVLRFEMDNSISRGNRVLTILEQLEKDSPPE